MKKAKSMEFNKLQSGERAKALFCFILKKRGSGIMLPEGLGQYWAKMPFVLVQDSEKCSETLFMIQ